MKSVKFIAASLLLMAMQPAQANTNTDTLKQRIIDTRTELTALEKSLNNKSLKQSQQTESLLKEVASLRKKAASQQRVADEQMLSLNQLSDRVEAWAAQVNYQQQVLESYFNNTGISTKRSDEGNLIVDQYTLIKVQAHLKSALAPSWQKTPVVINNGVIKELDVLPLGPVKIAYDKASQSGGLLRDTINNAYPSIQQQAYQANNMNMLQDLFNTGQALLSFDPTLGNASKIQKQDKGILQHIEKGGVWALPILFFGTLSLIVSLIKAAQLLRLPKIDINLSQRLNQITSSSMPDKEAKLAAVTETLSGPQKQLVNIAIETPISQHRDDLLVAYLMEYRHKVERFLGAIATSAAIAPLLGLLGTVSGMISTFMMMNTFGTGDAATVSGGISEALITTELGLIVAIPSLIVSALLSRRSKSYNAKLETNAIRLSKVEFA
ncbi:MotA/TolQ/ExbB proton channel family protein [Catenovulum sp. SM1970]|uniref:MotA/TolQ/ExbB proton channel family protein n=1 Tax=Marinifaba aquimaris TaxID=2741323 RepID=UPI001571792B|nr:MotA/TolQ/ExbB proton channel family protein [Marinifaba aquimaris]NTS76680.1 MotA/TolQ/ExbB proton channel family protein [Marinifaba aquimaris]